MALSIAEEVGVQQIELRAASPSFIEVIVAAAAQHPRKCRIRIANAGCADLGMAAPEQHMAKGVKWMVWSAPGYARSEVKIMQAVVNT